jgi:8-oxo-dGTP pyrophosphatase MutT (NUDIX family)
MVRDFGDSNITILLPGGGIDSHETSLVAVKREIKEELGIDTRTDPVLMHTYIGKRNIFPDEMSYYKGVDQITDIFDFYYYKLSRFDTLSIVNNEHEKFKDVSFVSPNAIEAYAKKHKAKIGMGIDGALKALTTISQAWT